MAGVLSAGRWRPRAGGGGRSACTGGGDTSAAVPSSPLAGSSLQPTALLSKRWTVARELMLDGVRRRVLTADPKSTVGRRCQEYVTGDQAGHEFEAHRTQEHGQVKFRPIQCP